MCNPRGQGISKDHGLTIVLMHRKLLPITSGTLLKKHWSCCLVTGWIHWTWTTKPISFSELVHLLGMHVDTWGRRALMDLRKKLVGRGLLLLLRQLIQAVTRLAYVQQHEPPRRKLWSGWIYYVGCMKAAGCVALAWPVGKVSFWCLITIAETAQGCAGILKILDSGVLLTSMWEQVVLAPLKMKCAFAGGGEGVFLTSLIPT